MARDFLATNSEYEAFTGAPVTAPPFTLFCWFVTYSTTGQFLLSIADTLNAGGVWFALNLNDGGPGQVNLQVNAAGTFDEITGSVGYALGRWGALAGVFTTTSNRTLWFNGALVGSSAVLAVPPLVATRTAIGCLGDFSGPRIFTTGRIASPAVWAAALDPNEILALTQGADPLTIRRQALVETWNDLGTARVDARNSMTTVLGRPVSTKALRQDWDGVRSVRSYGSRRVLKVG